MNLIEAYRAETFLITPRYLILFGVGFQVGLIFCALAFSYFFWKMSLHVYTYIKMSFVGFI